MAAPWCTWQYDPSCLPQRVFQGPHKSPDKENRFQMNKQPWTSVSWRLWESENHFPEWVATAHLFPKERENKVPRNGTVLSDWTAYGVMSFSFLAFSATLYPQSSSCLSSAKTQSTAILNSHSWEGGVGGVVQQILEGIGCGSFILRKE